MKNILVITIFVAFFLMSNIGLAVNYIYQENGDSYKCDAGVVSPLYFNDSIWTTYANPSIGTTQNCYVNYTKPAFASSNSIWQEKDQPTTNVTVISSCYSQTPLQFRSQMYWDNINPSLSYVSWSCYNGAGWSALDTNYSTYTAYEEAMFWNTSINSCTNLTMAGTYTLDSDLTGHQAGWNRCLSVHTDNVILDCQGHKIENYTSSGDFVIALGGYENITIKNCIMNNYTYGIYMGNTDHSTIYNNSISNMYGYGLSVVSNADNNNISYNNITNVTTTDGIRVNSNSDNNYIGHNRVNNTPSEFGIALWTNCSNNTVEYNVVDGANVGILTQLGSWYNNISHNTIYDNTQRGMMFLDNASYNTVYNNTFYGAFTQACLLTQRNNTGNIYDSNNLITCGTYGFWELISGGYNSNLTYKNNYIYNSTNGIYSIGGSDLNIDNNTILKTNYGIYATNTTNVNATYNNVTDIVWSGIELQGANNTYLYDNNVSNGYNAVNRSTGFNIDHSNYTYIYDNLFNNLTSGLESIYAEWGGGVRSVVAGHDMEVHDNAVTNSGFGIGISEMYNINVYNNDVSARQFGIWSILSSATNVNIYNNSIHDVRDAIGSGYASLVTYSQNNFYNNTVYNNTYGIRVGYTSTFPYINSNLTNSYNNTVYGNDYGLFVNSNSHDNNFTDDLVYNNSISDVKVVSGFNNRFRNVTIGYDDNKVKSSFDGTNYTIKQVLTSERPSNPIGYKNVADYLNMTNSTANGWIFINMTYNQSIIDSYNIFSEDSMRLWRNSSGTWTEIGDGVDTVNDYVYANVSDSEFGSIFAPMGSTTHITECNTTINDAGDYVLDNSINITSDGYTTTLACIDINSNDVVLDCNGYEIIGNDTDTTYGVFSNQKANITIRNCTIYNFTNAIDFNAVNSSVIDNNTIYINNNRGISVNSGKENNMTNNYVFDNDKIGIYYNSSYNSIIDNNDVYNNSVSCSPAPSPSCCGIGGNYNATITNNRIYGNNNGDGITINGDYNVIRSNEIYNNSDTIYIFWGSEHNLIDLNNIYNNSGGIYIAYATSYNNITSNIMSNNGAWGIFSSGSATLSQRIINGLIQNNTVSNHTNQNIYVYGNNDTLIDDNTLYGSSGTSLIIQDSSRINVTNNDIYDGSIGISMTSYLNDSLVENNNIYRGVQGIYTTQATNNIIRNNNLYNYTNQGIHLSGSSINNIVTLNDLDSPTSNYAGIHVNGSSNYNNVYLNNIFSSGNFGIEITSNNHNNVSNNYVVDTVNNVINTDSSDDTLVENNYIEIKSPNMIGITFVGTTPQNNIARNNTVIGQSSGQLGILAHRCDGCLFDINDMSNLSSQGIAVDVESKDCNITNNYVHDGSGIGIQSYSYGYAPVTNILISRNNVTNVGNLGIHMNTANNSRIEYNTILNESIGNDNHAVLLTNSNDTVVNNNYIENYGFGIDVRGSSDPHQVVSFNNTVENNYISPNIDNIAYGQYGVGVCCGAYGTKIINNTALHTDYGINVWWYNVDDTLVENNTVYDCSRQIDVRGDASPSLSNMLSGVVVRGNTFYDTNFTRNYGVIGLYMTNVSDMLVENNTWTNLSTYQYPFFTYFDQPIVVGNGADNFDNITIRYNNVTKSVLGVEIQTGVMTNTKIHDNYFETDVYGIGVVFACGSGTCVNDSIYNNVMTGNTETFLSSGYVSTGDNSPIEVYNNTMYNNQWGIRLGLTAFAYQPTTNTIFHNNTIYNNTIGVYINSGSYNNTFSYDWIFNNTDWDVQVLHGTNTFNFVKLGYLTNEWSIDSMISNNVSFKDVKVAERFADPPSYKNISRYINATNQSVSNYLTLNMSYDDSDWISAGIYNDSYLGMWKNSGSGWDRLPSTVDTTNNYVYANLSNNFSQMAILGDTIIDVDGDGYLNTVDCDDFNYTIRPIENNTNYNLNSDLLPCRIGDTIKTYYNTSFEFASDNLTIDCNNTLFIGENLTSFIEVNGRNNISIVNCIEHNYTKGIYYLNSFNSINSNNTLFNNSINEIDVSGTSENVIFNNITIGSDNSTVLMPIMNGQQYIIKEVPFSSRPLINITGENYTDIGVYVQANNSGSGWMDMSMHYTEAQLLIANVVNESNIRMWRHDGSDWYNLTNSTIDIANNNVYSGNVTNFSIFAPLGIRGIDILVNASVDPIPTYTSINVTMYSRFSFTGNCIFTYNKTGSWVNSSAFASTDGWCNVTDYIGSAYDGIPIGFGFYALSAEGDKFTSNSFTPFVNPNLGTGKIVIYIIDKNKILATSAGSVNSLNLGQVSASVLAQLKMILEGKFK